MAIGTTMTAQNLEALARAGIRHVRNACGRKRLAITSEAAAQAHADALNRQPPRSGPNLPTSPYRCSGCGFWHVGRLRRAPGDLGRHLKTQGES